MILDQVEISKWYVWIGMIIIYTFAKGVMLERVIELILYGNTIILIF
jgi:hypothetical protein